jgi:hypothetical protein
LEPWCNETGKCAPDAECCPSGEKKCGTGKCDKFCCSEEPCIYKDGCVTEGDCCAARSDDFNTFLLLPFDVNGNGVIDPATDLFCCPIPSNYIYTGENMNLTTLEDGPRPTKGCCYLDPNDVTNTDCCAAGTSWDTDTKTCIPPCPCEGCCDFNCCDELDFFLHKAFDDHYHTHYAKFDAFYADWYHDFYHWWVGGI